MPRPREIEAVFEDGVFKPLDAVDLPEHQRVALRFSVKDDLPAELLARVAEEGGAFDFLAAPGEDLYSLEDGEPVCGLPASILPLDCHGSPGVSCHGIEANLGRQAR